MTIKLGGFTMETSTMDCTEEEKAGKSETESSSEAGTQEKKAQQSLTERLKGLKNLVEADESDSGGTCIIVGYHQKPSDD
jgi:hypothetical protein